MEPFITMAAHTGMQGTPPLVLRAQLHAQWRLGLMLLVFLLAATLPYSWLIRHFGYADILREPAADILVRFQAGGPALVAAWLCFGASSLLFIPVALGFARPLAPDWPVNGAARILGVGAAIVQAIGLLRWVLVVPMLANGYADPAASVARREALVVAFEVIHRYGGMVVGELTGQLLLAGWTALIAYHMYRTRLVHRALAMLGALTLPLWLLGQSELLHLVLPAIVSVDVIPAAFMLWELWLWLTAFALLWQARGLLVKC